MLTLLSIHCGPVVDIPAIGSDAWWDRPWRTGFLKTPHLGSVLAGPVGLAGDSQADLVNHGGPDKALCVYPTEHLAYWNAVLAPLRLEHGSFGENFSTQGCIEDAVCIGDVFHAASGAVFQISQPRQPCWKLARRWRVQDLAMQAEQTGRTGWYFRVLQAGQISAGTTLRLHHRPHPQWTVAVANTIMHRQKNDRDAAAALAACPALSASWLRTLSARAAGAADSSQARQTQP
ncbi:MAG: MOSC domain-containing protein [Verrucomicrobiales bacterium]|nr:MOSC domain-containing protein [Verrucomicrobiales bacterium]